MKATPRSLTLSLCLLLTACADPDPAQPALCVDCAPADMNTATDLPSDADAAPDLPSPLDMTTSPDDMTVAGCGPLMEGSGKCGMGREILFCEDSTLQTTLCPEGTICGDDGGELACFCDDLSDMLCPDPACVNDTDCEQPPVCDCTNKTCGCEGACGTCGAGLECVEFLNSASCAPVGFINYTVSGAQRRSHDATAASARTGQQRSPVYCDLDDTFGQKQLNLRVDTQHPAGHTTYIQLSAREDERADGVYMSTSDELISALYSELKDSGNLRYGYMAGQEVQGCQLTFRSLRGADQRSYVEGSFTCTGLPGLNTASDVELSATFRCNPCR
jgi:hypothetical protein